jgi:hypothetical protein
LCGGGGGGRSDSALGRANSGSSGRSRPAWGLRFGDWGVEFRLWVSGGQGFGSWGLRFGDWGVGFGAWVSWGPELEFRVEGSGSTLTSKPINPQYKMAHSLPILHETGIEITTSWLWSLLHEFFNATSKEYAV